MKLTTLAIVFGIVGSCIAGPSFKLSFPEKKFAPEAKSKAMITKAIISDENFIAGPDGKFAFVLTEKNAENKKVPAYSAAGNFPFTAGSAEVTFKILKRKPGSQLRILHVFSPAKDDAKSVLIYYMYIDVNGKANFGIQVGKKQVQVVVPAKMMTPDAFNTAKMVWNDKKLSVVMNGKVAGEVPMTADFAEVAAKKRGWSSIFIVPVFGGVNENWSNRAAIASIDIK